MTQRCTKCDKPSIPGLINGCGKCQYHWNEGVWGKEWADRLSKGSMNAFDIYLDGAYVDTVFSTEEDAEITRQQLINHDGFDPRITVIKQGA